MGRSLRLGVSLRQREGQQACWPETMALSPILNDSEGRVPSPPERPPRLKQQVVWGCLHGLHQSTGSTCRANAQLRASLRVQGRGECLPGAAELGSQSWGQGKRGRVQPRSPAAGGTADAQLPRELQAPPWPTAWQARVGSTWGGLYGNSALRGHGSSWSESVAPSPGAGRLNTQRLRSSPLRRCPCPPGPLSPSEEPAFRGRGSFEVTNAGLRQGWSRGGPTAGALEGAGRRDVPGMAHTRHPLRLQTS